MASDAAPAPEPTTVAESAPAPAPLSVDEEIALLEADQRQRLPRGNIITAFAEPALTVASSIPAEVAAGGRAIYETATGGNVREGVESTREAMTYEPRTRGGAQAMDLLGSGLGALMDAGNFVVSGLAGAGELVSGQGVEQATETMRDVQERGTGKALGERTFEVTENPVFATFVESVPTAALELLGLKGLRAGKKATPEVLARASKVAENLKTGVDGAVKRVAGQPELRVYDDQGMFTEETIQILRDKQRQGVDVEAEIAGDLREQGVLPEGVALETPDVEATPKEIPSPTVGEADNLTAAQAERLNLFKKRGVEPTRANITQTTDDWRVQQDAIKQTGDVSELVAYQDARLADLAREGKAQIGYVADDLPSTNQSLADVVVDIAETADRAVQEAYAAAREAAPDAKNVRLSQTAEALRVNAPSNKAAGGTIKQIRGLLEEKGIMGKDGWQTKGRIDVETAESIRQELNQIWGEASDGSRQSQTTRRIISDIKDALDNDVSAAVGEDIFFDARRSKQRFHELIERRKTSKFDQRTGSLLEDILYNKVNQDKIVDKIKASRPEEFQQLQEFYLNQAGDAGISAWNNLKAQIIQEAIDAAQGAKGEGGIPTFNGRQFARRFQQLRTTKAGRGKNAPTKYDALFSPEERAIIDDVIELSDLRRPNKAVPLGSGPSGLAIQRAIDSLWQRMPDALGGGLEKRKAKEFKRLEKKALDVPEKQIAREAKEAIAEEKQRRKK